MNGTEQVDLQDAFAFDVRKGSKNAGLGDTGIIDETPQAILACPFNGGCNEGVDLVSQNKRCP